MRAVLNKPVTNTRLSTQRYTQEGLSICFTGMVIYLMCIFKLLTLLQSFIQHVDCRYYSDAWLLGRIETPSG